MNITRPRAIDCFVLATGLFSFRASSRVNLAGASPKTSSTLPEARSAIVPQLRKFTLLPLRRKDIELVRRLRALVRREHNRLPIWSELGESREPAEIGHLFQIASVGVHQIQFKLSPVTVMLVGGEQNLFPIRSERRRKTRASEIRDLLGVPSLAIRHKQLHF